MMGARSIRNIRNRGMSRGNRFPRMHSVNGIYLLPSTTRRAPPEWTMQVGQALRLLLLIFWHFMQGDLGRRWLVFIRSSINRSE